MLEIPVIIAIPALMSSVLRQAVTDGMRERFPGLTVTLEEAAVLVPRFGRFLVSVDGAAKKASDFAPSTITRYLADAFPLIRTPQSSRGAKADAREIGRFTEIPTMSNESRAPSHEEFCALARKYWEEEGRPEGRAEEHWLRAVAELRLGGESQPDGYDIPREATDRV